MAWYEYMMKLRSFQTVVLLFAKHFEKYRNFDAVIETAREYPYANIHGVSRMLDDVGVIEHGHTFGVEYDISHLIELIESIEYEQDGEDI